MNTLRLAILSMLLLFGCSESPFPLGPPEASPMYPEIAGVWEYLDDSSDELITARVIPFNDHEYYIEYTSQDLPDGEVEISRLRGFITKVDQSDFANIQLLEEEEKTYLICKLDIAGADSLFVGILDDDRLEDMESSEQLLALVREILETGDPEKFDTALFKRKN